MQLGDYQQLIPILYIFYIVSCDCAIKDHHHHHHMSPQPECREKPLKMYGKEPSGC